MEVEESDNQINSNDQSNFPGLDFSMNAAYASSNLNNSRTYHPHPRDPRVNQITFQLNPNIGS
jgi:hypothetical protein